MSELLHINSEYAAWVKDVGKRFRQCQIKAASKVNEEMLKFYWSLGKDIFCLEKEAPYGSAFYKTISSDLQTLMPDVKSFSVTNLKYMKSFYALYSENRQQPVDDFTEYEIVFQIPWGHHVQIIGKCKGDREKALFYVRETLRNNWSRAVLMNFLGTNLYERQGKAISNFNELLPSPQGDLAQEMTRDPYNFDFLTLRTDYDERELKDALMANVQRFLLELGTGFAFVGREYRLVVGETEQFVDMLFYHIQNHCYVVVEIKTRDFQPADMGQIGTYVAAIDGILRREEDNQTIGLLICKSKDNVLAKYAVNMVNIPVGISVYDVADFIPEDYRSSMPTIEEIENELKD